VKLISFHIVYNVNYRNYCKLNYPSSKSLNDFNFDRRTIANFQALTPP